MKKIMISASSMTGTCVYTIANAQTCICAVGTVWTCLCSRYCVDMSAQYLLCAHIFLAVFLIQYTYMYGFNIPASI